MSLTQLRSRGILDGTITAGDFASGVGGKVLQVVSTNKVDTFTTSSGSLVDITGLSVSITPSSASNKIFIIVSLIIGNTGAGEANYLSLLRNSTLIGGGTAASSRPSSFTMAVLSATTAGYFVGGQFLDSPATTSAITYKMQIRCSGTATVGRTGEDSDSVDRPRFASTITVMEIAA